MFDLGSVDHVGLHSEEGARYWKIVKSTCIHFITFYHIKNLEPQDAILDLANFTGETFQNWIVSRIEANPFFYFRQELLEH